MQKQSPFGQKLFENTLAHHCAKVFFGLVNRLLALPVFLYTRGRPHKLSLSAAAFSVAIAAILTVGFLHPLTVHATAADTVNFQARLESNTGAIVSDGSYNIEFKLYDAQTGGSLLWTEDYLNSASQGVSVTDGYLSVQLGSITAFPDTINWGQQLYLTMNVGGTSTSGTVSWDGEMAPRLSLTAIPYAFQAGSAGQLQTTDGSNSSTLSFTAPTGTDSITLPDASGMVCLETSADCGFAQLSSGVAGRVARFSDTNTVTASSLLYDDGDYVGVGSATDNAFLSVQGPASATLPTMLLQGSTSSTANILDIEDSSGKKVATVGSTGSVVLQNSTDSAAAFQVQSAGSTPLLTADTVNMAASVGGNLDIGSDYGNRLFSDGFESGNLSFWTNSGMTIDSSLAHNGKYSAKMTMDNSAADAVTPLAPSSTMDMRGYVYITSYSTNVNLLTLYDTAGYGPGLYLNGSGDLCFWNDAAGAAVGCSSSPLSTGAWHEIEATVSASATNGTVQVWLDGTSILNVSGQDTDASNFDELEIGDDNTDRTATVNFDDVAVDSSAVGPLPSASLNVGDSLHVGGTSSFGGDVSIQPDSDSTTAFQVQNAAGTALISTDTTADMSVTIAGQAAGWDTVTADAATLYVGENSTSGRSINAAGTINASGADYAEWIPWSGTKPDQGTVISYQGSDYVVSSPFQAAFVGNDKGSADSVLVTFAGQVEVKVTGTVNVGDILVDNGDGTARAVSPADASVGELLGKIAIAEEASDDAGVKLLKASVGTTSSGVAAALQNQSASFANISIAGSADVGALNVSGQTDLGDLSVRGSAVFHADNNGTAVFQVEDAGGNPMFSVDTLNGVIQVGSAAPNSNAVLLRLNNYAGAQEPNEIDGAMYYNAALGGFRCGVGGAWQSCGSFTASAAGAASAGTGDANEDAFAAAPAVGQSFVIPANFCIPGRVITVHGSGYYSTAAANTGVTFRVRLDNSSGTLMGATQTAANAGQTVSNQAFNFNLPIDCRTAGQQGTVDAEGWGTVATGGNTSIVQGPMWASGANAPGDITVDTTAQHAIVVTVQFTGANAGNSATLRQLTITSTGP